MIGVDVVQKKKKSGANSIIAASAVSHTALGTTGSVLPQMSATNKSVSVLKQEVYDS